MPKLLRTLALGFSTTLVLSACQSAADGSHPAVDQAPPQPAAAPLGESAPMQPAAASAGTLASTAPSRTPSEEEPLEILPSVDDVMEQLGLTGSQERIALGRQLFHDTRLSKDHTVSCASCHDLRFGGIDRTPRAVGIRSQVGPLNTPTVFNAALSIAQFWDGRAKDLATQAGGPPQAAGEMGSCFEEITGRLQADQGMVQTFAKAFPDEVTTASDVTKERILEAIATFEATLLTPGSRFDQWLSGDQNALTDEELHGYGVFKEVGCAQCHYGPAIGGKTFQKLGQKNPFFTDQQLTHADLGRFNVTQDERDRHAFKVPTLRNVALTAPYLHDGSVATLEETVRLMGHHQLGLELKPTQIGQISAFLRSLTGTYDGKPLDGAATR